MEEDDKQNGYGPQAVNVRSVAYPKCGQSCHLCGLRAMLLDSWVNKASIQVAKVRAAGHSSKYLF